LEQCGLELCCLELCCLELCRLELCSLEQRLLGRVRRKHNEAITKNNPFTPSLIATESHLQGACQMA
jgi:hypothetical protein